MNVSIDIDDTSWLAIDNLETEAQRIAARCAGAIAFGAEPMEVAILFTDDETIAELNQTWRGKEGSPSFLSFPPSKIDNAAPDMPRHVGDIALAYGVVAHEADEQGKPLASHMTHLLVHGLLHLAGYDHMTAAEARIMEAREIDILHGLGIADPYGSEARA